MQNSDSSQLLNLSLFIMLLAFFIVLNTLSSFEDIKIKPIIESLELTFSTKAQRQDYLPSMAPDPIQSIHDGDTIERIDALFQAQISSFEATKSKSQGVMHVKVPYEIFSSAILAVGQQRLERGRRPANRNFFLPTLVSLIKAEDTGTPYRMDIIINIEDNPADMQSNAPQKLNQIVKRIGLFSQRLEDNGLPQNLMSIGLQKGDPDFVELFFQAHIPFNPATEPTDPGL